MELHIVNKHQGTGDLAVLGIFFTPGAPSPLLQRFFDSLPATKDAAPFPVTLSVAEDLPKNTSYWVRQRFPST
jgi:carbonic anhydrase